MTKIRAKDKHMPLPRCGYCAKFGLLCDPISENRSPIKFYDDIFLATPDRQVATTDQSSRYHQSSGSAPRLLFC